MNSPLIDAARSCQGYLLGLAIGDALGSTLKFEARDAMPLVRDLAIAQSQTTHAAPVAYDACAYFASLLVRSKDCFSVGFHDGFDGVGNLGSASESAAGGWQKRAATRFYHQAMFTRWKPLFGALITRQASQRR